MPPSSRCLQPAKVLLTLRDTPQSQAARDLGCSAAYLGRVLNGREKASDAFKARLAEYLGVPVEDLFIDDDDDVVVQLVRRTTKSSNVPERLEDVATSEKVGALLRRDVG